MNFTENFEIESRKIEFGIETENERINEPIDVSDIIIDDKNYLPF